MAWLGELLPMENVLFFMGSSALGLTTLLLVGPPSQVAMGLPAALSSFAFLRGESIVVLRVVPKVFRSVGTAWKNADFDGIAYFRRSTLVILQLGWSQLRMKPLQASLGKQWR